jgi:hypothetical protein
MSLRLKSAFGVVSELVNQFKPVRLTPRLCDSFGSFVSQNDTLLVFKELGASLVERVIVKCIVHCRGRRRLVIDSVFHGKRRQRCMHKAVQSNFSL